MTPNHRTEINYKFSVLKSIISDILLILRSFTLQMSRTLLILSLAVWTMLQFQMQLQSNLRTIFPVTVRTLNAQNVTCSCFSISLSLRLCFF